MTRFSRAGRRPADTPPSGNRPLGRGPVGALHLGLISRGRVYGAFRTLEDVHECTARLLDLGLGGQAIQMLMGEDGTEALDLSGHRHGLWARLLRVMQGLTDERGHLEGYIEALGWGEIVLSVDLSGQAARVPEVAQAFRECGAHFVNHYGPWVVEPLTA